MASFSLLTFSPSETTAQYLYRMESKYRGQQRTLFFTCIVCILHLPRKVQLGLVRTNGTTSRWTITDSSGGIECAGHACLQPSNDGSCRTLTWIQEHGRIRLNLGFHARGSSSINAKVQGIKDESDSVNVAAGCLIINIQQAIVDISGTATVSLEG